MELPITLQLAQVCAAVLAGAALGMCYDILKILRLRLRAWPVTVLLDLIFWLGAALSLFALGLGPGKGQLRLFMLACALGGGLLYFASLSPLVLAALGAAADFLGKILGFAVKPLLWTGKQFKKTQKLYKNIFQKISKWFTITGNSKRGALTRGKGDVGNEAKAGRYYY